MTVSFFAQNNEFGTATDDNVDVTANTSEFDDPPSDSTNLVVTSNPGDTDPRLFEIGDTYDVTWDTPDGAFTMEDAAVVRSDEAPGGGGIIVLEGTDQNGDTAQVIWTPDFDLQGWWASAAGDDDDPEPQFFTSDTNAGYSHTYVCFAAGTLIDTASGPMPVETLQPGTDVLTLDNGLQPILWIGQRSTQGYGPKAPVRFETGVLGNVRPLYLSPQHRLLVRGPWVNMMMSHDEVIISAKDFVGARGVTRHQCPRVTWVHFILPRHHIVWADGALCETLLPGSMATDTLGVDGAFVGVMERLAAERRDYQPVRPIVRGAVARLLAHHAIDDPAHAARNTRAVSAPRTKTALSL